jgi:hypothetical protein
MAVPSRRDRMIQNFMSVNQKKKGQNSKCQKQFPECPDEINEKDCKGCPFY